MMQQSRREMCIRDRHGTLTTGKVFAGVTVLANLCKNLLHDDELIRYKRKILRKLRRTGVALDIQNGTAEAEEVAQHGIILVIQTFQRLLNIGLLFQDTLLDHFVQDVYKRQAYTL